VLFEVVIVTTNGHLAGLIAARLEFQCGISSALNCTLHSISTQLHAVDHHDLHVHVPWEEEEMVEQQPPLIGQKFAIVASHHAMMASDGTVLPGDS